ncbi:MAG: hypothetical protein Q9213_005398 [Squamulea squamosa]
MSDRKGGGASSTGGTNRYAGKKYGGREQSRQQPPAQAYGSSGVIPRLDTEITKAEDTQLKQIQSARSVDVAKFPTRPAYGNQGNNVLLRANCFELFPPAKLVLHRYDVSVNALYMVKGKPEVKKIAGKKLNQAFRLILEAPQLQQYRKDIVTDFKAQLLCRIAFDDEVLEGLPLRIQYRAENEDSPGINAPTLEVDIKQAGDVTVSELTDYLTSMDTQKILDKQPFSQALNIFLRHHAKESLDHATVGKRRSFLMSPETIDKCDLGAGLIAVRGFLSSVRLATTRILVNVNVAHAPFYSPVSLDRTMRTLGYADRGSKIKLEAFLKRVRIKTAHIKSQQKAGQTVARVKTIFGLAKPDDGRTNKDESNGNNDPPPMPPVVSEFGAGPLNVRFWISGDQKQPLNTPLTSSAGNKGGQRGKSKIVCSTTGSTSKAESGSNSNGRYISVAEHFKANYGIQTDSKLPVVNVGTASRPSYLPAEACEILSGQSSQAKLDAMRTAKMIRFAVRNPQANESSIAQDSPNVLGLTPCLNEAISHFNIDVVTNMITVPGRILQPPKVKYNELSPAIINARWNIANPLKLSSGATMESWHVLILHWKPSPFDPTETQNRMETFGKALEGIGIKVPTKPPTGGRIAIDSPNDPKLEKTIREIKTQVCLILLPGNDKALYDRIKYIADIKVGLHTVCVVEEKFANPRPDYMANVALKFNLKLGGNNQKVDYAKLDLLWEGQTMIVGIDVTHPSPGSTDMAPSVAGMVASVDRDLGQWPATLRVQEPEAHELVLDLTIMLKTRLYLWKEKNKQLPRNILIYRDGVSEGEYSLVLQTELPLLRKACSDVYSNVEKGPPKITIIIVGKRHHIRFFPTARSSPKVTNLKTGNPVNGTVVDRHVTEAQHWDFYLQSHNAIKGTARPAHYFVILDEIFSQPKSPQSSQQNRANVLEDLTHSLCYLYGRATTAVSICTPVYYAHLVCERARCYLSGHYTKAEAGQSGHPKPTKPTQADVEVNKKLRDTMFYI